MLNPKFPVSPFFPLNNEREHSGKIEERGERGEREREREREGENK